MAEWAIPQAILDAAPRRPFVFIPEMFAAPAPGTFELSLSNRRAAEALGDGGSVLDVGCGGGAAALAVAPTATRVIGTDRQPDMLELFSATAQKRSIAASVVAGSWPEVADQTPIADVVVCHGVLYNVTAIAPFVAALDAHARRRVVIEITPKHPQDRRRKLWRHFWDLDRPREPTASTAVEVLVEAGLSPIVEESLLPEDFASKRSDLEAAHWCRNMCLPPERDETPVADVVVCHNVLYNVADIAPFVAALDAHARRRVVIEITPKHPQDRRRKLWRHFWDLDRPREPTASTAVEVLVEAGLSPVVEESLLAEDRFASKRSDLEAAHLCRYMCLPPEREAEVAALVAEAPFPRERVTIWWDTDR